MDINETVEKYIRCHELQATPECDGDCHTCEFWIPDTSHTALEKLRHNVMENMS